MIERGSLVMCVLSIRTLDERHLSRAAEAASKSFLGTVAALAAMTTTEL